LICNHRIPEDDLKLNGLQIDSLFFQLIPA
jgi:hypothetical protein